MYFTILQLTDDNNYSYLTIKYTYKNTVKIYKVFFYECVISKCLELLKIKDNLSNVKNTLETKGFYQTDSKLIEIYSECNKFEASIYYNNEKISYEKHYLNYDDKSILIKKIISNRFLIKNTDTFDKKSKRNQREYIKTKLYHDNYYYEKHYDELINICIRINEIYN